MNKIEYLLSCISEESGEIVQIVGKAHRFGLYDMWEDNQNFIKLRNEIHHLIAVYEMFCDEFQMQPDFNLGIIEKKKKKVLKFMKYSEEVGTLINN